MRPQSMIYFDWLYGLSLLLSALQIPFQPANPEMPGTTNYFIYAGLFAVALLFWYAISLRASNAMRWIYSILVGLNLIAALIALAASASLGTLALALVIFGSVVDVVSVYMLFTADAKYWFATGGDKGAVNPSVFR